MPAHDIMMLFGAPWLLRWKSSFNFLYLAQPEGSSLDPWSFLVQLGRRLAFHHHLWCLQGSCDALSLDTGSSLGGGVFWMSPRILDWSSIVRFATCLPNHADCAAILGLKDAFFLTPLFSDHRMLLRFFLRRGSLRAPRARPSARPRPPLLGGTAVINGSFCRASAPRLDWINLGLLFWSGRRQIFPDLGSLFAKFQCPYMF